MRGIKGFLWAVFFLLGTAVGFAQSGGRIGAAEELQSLRDALKAPGLSAGKRQELLIRQARLFQLMGGLEEAAEAWNRAAFADPENQNDVALLEGAFCLFGLGDLEKAEIEAKTVILTAEDKAVQYRARYLLAHIAAFRSEDLSSLIELMSDPGYDQFRPALYYTLWKFSGADQYKARLLAEYPGSPEALMVRDPARVLPFPSPLWLCFPGRNRITFGPADSPAPARTAEVLQTGLFGKEENAKTMAARLKAAGFEASVTRRTANDGISYWVVTVPPGLDINRTIAQLKEKGFDSFPVF